LFQQPSNHITAHVTAGAFFVAVTWLSGQLINTYKLHPNVALAITIVSLIFNTIGLSIAGYGGCITSDGPWRRLGRFAFGFLMILNTVT
jgi:hypothetical protein